MATSAIYLPETEHGTAERYESLIRIATSIRAQQEPRELFGVLVHELGKVLQFDAIAQFEAALKLRPGYAEAHNNLGTALSQIPGRLPEAIPHFEAALKSNPDSAEMHVNLGNALSEIPGRLPDAIENLSAAVRIRPDFAEAHYLLGVALARTPGRANEALAQLEEAQRLQPDPKLQSLIDRLRARMR